MDFKLPVNPVKIFLPVLCGSCILLSAGEAGEKTSLSKRLIRTGNQAAQAAVKISAELKSIGISAGELFAEARKNPGQFLIPVPGHTRKRLILIPARCDKIIADFLLGKYKQSGKFYSDPAAGKKIEKIMEQLHRAASLPSRPRYFLLNDLSINAFCLPDGTILVTRGAIANLSQKKLAALLAHETGHAAARHSAEKITKVLMQKAVAAYLSSRHGVLTVLGYGVGSRLGFLLPYSRQMELEADKLAMIFLKKAGFDPHALVALLKHIETETQNRKWLTEYLSTHPLTSNRIKHARNVLKELKEK